MTNYDDFEIRINRRIHKITQGLAGSVWIGLVALGLSVVAIGLAIWALIVVY